MNANDIIKLLPEELLNELALETKVDHQVKKLSGEIIFKLILFSMLNSDKLSLRVMESFLSSATFKSFAQEESLESKYNSIRDRICTINVSYFEQLFHKIFEIYNKELKEEKALSKTDSTYVSLSINLLSNGMMVNNAKNSRSIKYSVNIKGSLPSSVKVFTNQSYVSEDLALSDLINNAEELEGNIVVFDRGLQSRESFDKFTQSKKEFVSRANTYIRCKTEKQVVVSDKPEDSSVTIHSDEIGYLLNKKEKKTEHLYRVIKGKIDESGKEICFVTNMLEEEAYVIASLYKQRWEIEVFFKFIKQHLNVKHLVSRDINGIKVMLYMTMVLAMLIIVYKKLNNIKGFKIAKLRFEIELENDIIKEIVKLCGGDPNKAKHLFNPG